MYYLGEGVPKDDKKALVWLTKAAEQGHPKATARLGIMYYFGKDVPQDYKKAFFWVAKLAEQGCSRLPTTVLPSRVPSRRTEPKPPEGLNRLYHADERPAWHRKIHDCDAEPVCLAEKDAGRAAGDDQDPPYLRVV